MDRGSFIKTNGSLAVVSAAATKGAFGFVPAHNWEKYDFGPGPAVANRLNQGPFPIYEVICNLPSVEKGGVVWLKD